MLALLSFWLTLSPGLHSVLNDVICRVFQFSWSCVTLPRTVVMLEMTKRRDTRLEARKQLHCMNIAGLGNVNPKTELRFS